MQITFDTTNPADLALLDKLLTLAVAAPTPATPVAAPVAVADDLQKVEATQPAAEPAAEPVAEKPKRGRKPKAEQPEPVAEVDERQLELPEPVAEAKPLTIDEVRAALQQFTAAKGVPAGIELLKKFNASRISELAEDNYASFVAECAA